MNMKRAEKMLLIPEDKYSRMMEKINVNNPLTIPVEENNTSLVNEVLEPDCVKPIRENNNKNQETNQPLGNEEINKPLEEIDLKRQLDFSKIDGDISNMNESVESIKDKTDSTKLLYEVDIEKSLTNLGKKKSYVSHRDLQLQKNKDGNTNVKHFLKPKWLKF